MVQLIDVSLTFSNAIYYLRLEDEGAVRNLSM